MARAKARKEKEVHHKQSKEPQRVLQSRRLKVKHQQVMAKAKARKAKQQLRAQRAAHQSPKLRAKLLPVEMARAKARKEKEVHQKQSKEPQRVLQSRRLKVKHQQVM